MSPYQAVYGGSYQAIDQSIDASFHPSIYPSVRLPVYVFIYLSIHIFLACMQNWHISPHLQTVHPILHVCVHALVQVSRDQLKLKPLILFKP